MLFSILFILTNYFILTTELDQTSHHQLEVLKLIGNDSLVYSSWLQEVPQPGRIRLVWANWRYNQAYTTVGLKIDTTSNSLVPLSVYPFISPLRHTVIF